MTDETSNPNIVHGDVGKLTTIGTVHGNVLIINEKTTIEAINKATKYSAPPLSQYPVSDISDYIKVIVKSKRFGRRVQFQVPQSMTVSAFTNLIVDVLQLPSTKTVDEFMISIDFRYSIASGETKLSPSKTLQDVGIQNNIEIELFVTTEWNDKIEGRRSEGISIQHLGPDRSSSRSELSSLIGLASALLGSSEARDVARKVIPREKIELWINNYFKYVDEIGT
jgi:hypothetical protein